MEKNDKTVACSVNLHFCHGKIFVWSPEDAILLREKFRIIGTNFGCYPLKPKQNIQLGLPLLLSNVEAKYVLEHQNFILLQSSIFSDDVDLQKHQVTIVEKRHLQHKIQTKLKQDQKWNDLDEMANEIKKGKLTKVLRKKSLPSPSVEGTVDSNKGKKIGCSSLNSFTSDDFEKFKRTEIEKIEQFGYEQTWINMPIKSELNHEHKKLCASDIYLSDIEKIKYAVFCDLHTQGYFITDGLKFGGHFLVYPGDPGLYHSIFIVFCIGFKEKLSATDYSALGRLATSVKKTLLLCSVNNDGQVIYSSFAWSGIA